MTSSVVRRTVLVVVVATAVMARPSSGQQGATLGWPLTLTPGTFPSASGTLEPQLTARGDRALLSWIQFSDDPSGLTRTTLMFSERTGGAWSSPRQTASGTDWFVNPADVPSVIRLAKGTLAAHWLQAGSEENDEADDVRLVFSQDNGRTWSKPVTPHHDGLPTQHGFVSMFEAPAGALGLIWLDGRAMTKPPAGAMMLRAASFASTGTQISETLVDDRVCECCPTSIAVSADGPITAFRNRGDDDVRDIFVSRLVNGRWTAGTPVHADGWKIAACPVNGPAIDARGKQVAVSWFTAPSGEGHTYVAFSDDAGRTFGAPVRVDEAGTAGRVSVVLLDDGSALVSWIEFANRQSQLQLRRITSSGVKSAPQVISEHPSGYPRMVRSDDELVLAWTESEQNVLRVRSATASLRPKK